jgi:hypothetical protein
LQICILIYWLGDDIPGCDYNYENNHRNNNIIWANTLWKIRSQLGAADTDRLVLASVRNWTTDSMSAMQAISCM